MNFKEIIKKLEEYKFVIGLPIDLKFKNKDGTYMTLPATKGTEVVKWKDVLKVLK